MIIVLLLRLRQSPWHLRRRVPALRLVVLHERLLKVEATLLLLELREPRCVVRCGGVRGEKCIRHHRQPRVDESCRLRDERAQATTSGIAGRLRGERRETARRRVQETTWLLCAEESATLHILLRLLEL